MVEIQEFEYDLTHSRGPNIFVPDCLSRDSFADRMSQESSANEESIKQVRDVYSLPQVADVLEGKLAEYGDIERYVQENEGFVIGEDGLQCPDRKYRTCVVMPRELRGQVQDYMHGSLFCGHYGIT
jgi:hypothetical protein